MAKISTDLLGFTDFFFNLSDDKVVKKQLSGRQVFQVMG